MIILSIDSTMSGCGVCLYDDNKKQVLASKTLEISRGQAEHLMPMIDDIVESYNCIDLIAVTKGPGAFTGMRIGLATAKALGLALGIPVCGVSTFQAIFQTYMSLEEAQNHAFYGVLLETKRQDYYFQLFDKNGVYADSLCATAQEVSSIIDNRECIILGDAASRFRAESSDFEHLSFYDILQPSPAIIAQIAGQEYSNGEFDCSPIYLRLPEIGKPKNIPRKLQVK